MGKPGYSPTGQTAGTNTDPNSNPSQEALQELRFVDQFLSDRFGTSITQESQAQHAITCLHNAMNLLQGIGQATGQVVGAGGYK